MPDDSNGVYSLPAGTIVSTGDTVLPSQHNPWANDNANAMSNRFSKDGRAPATGNWNLNNFRITALGSPVASTDAATKSYADAMGSVYATVSVNTPVGASDKGKWYRVTAGGVVIAPGAAATLGANHFFRIKNDSTGFILVDPSNGSETINGQPSISVPPGSETFIICDGANFFASPFVTSASQADFVSGLVLANNSSNPNTHVDISSGTAKKGSIFSLSSATFTKRLNATFTAGTNGGGLDTGSSAANSTYHVFSLRKQSDGTFDAVLTISASAPTATLLTGYDVNQRLGAVLTDASGNIRAFIQTGNDFYYNTVFTSLPTDLSATATRAKSLLTCVIPAGSRVLGYFQHTIIANNGDSGTIVTYADGVNANVEQTFEIYVSTAAKRSQGVASTYTDTSSRINFAYSPSAPGGSVLVKTIGWRDYQIPRVS